MKRDHPFLLSYWCKHKCDTVSIVYPGPTTTLAKKKGYNAWTKEEKDAVFKYLGAFVKNEKMPGKRDCENCIKQCEGVLVNRDWTAVKYCVKNIISRAKALRQKNT